MGLLRNLSLARQERKVAADLEALHELAMRAYTGAAVNALGSLPRAGSSSPPFWATPHRTWGIHMIGTVAAMEAVDPRPGHPRWQLIDYMRFMFEAGSELAPAISWPQRAFLKMIGVAHCAHTGSDPEAKQRAQQQMDFWADSFDRDPRGLMRYLEAQN